MVMVRERERDMGKHEKSNLRRELSAMFCICILVL